ncbi:hypothetical protein MPSEU_000109700 [Mayamaea pseudoterrestris]|nr:hypothetical protein MPSEU_000109700 [Mayamaea pseudoterrestris]
MTMAAAIARATRPAAATFSDYQRSAFSTQTKSTSTRADEELYEKSFSDEFDESDSIEVGKHKLTQSPAPSGTLTNNQEPSRARGRRDQDVWLSPLMNSSLWDSGLFSPRPLFGGFEDMFPRDLFPSMMRRRNDLMSMLNRDLADAFDPSMAQLIRSSPGYEIKENDKEYEIAVEVPKGMRASDMVVDMEDEGTCLHITGQRETEENGGRVRRYFEKSFMIGNDIDVENITANLHNGLLVVKAPKVPQEMAQRPGIPITENPHASSSSISSGVDASDETGVHEIPVETNDETGVHELPVETTDFPRDPAAATSSTSNQGGSKHRTEIPHENTRYVLADHKNDTGGPTKEYPVA